MGRWLNNIRRAAVGVITATLICSSQALADDEIKAKSKTSESDAASSLRSILKKAGKQGFIDVNATKQKSIVKAPELENPTPPPMIKLGDISCDDSSVLDLKDYSSTVSYDAVFSAKSALVDSKDLEDVLPLAKAYMALGFGVEMSGLVKNYKGHKARLIESMGPVIEGYPATQDYKTIEKYSKCNDAMRFWSEFARISAETNPENGAPFEFSYDDQDYLEEFPAHLKTLATLRLGIYTAEQRSKVTSTALLAKLEPKFRYGELSELKSDGLLYFYGLVRRIDNDPTARQIFKYLAERDGLYRLRSLQKLSEENLQSGAELYENYSDDIAAVSQQYNGQEESRQATLEAVKYYIINDQFIEAIEQAKRDLTVMDAERAQAVAFAAERLQSRLKDKLISHKLSALNAYLHDPEFFKDYEELTELKGSANAAAISLNMPELVTVILVDSEDLSSAEKDVLTYAETLIATKRGEYDKVVKLAKSYSGDPKFQALLLNAAIKTGNYKQTIASFNSKTTEAERLTLQSQIAWQNGQWGEAKIALEALANEDPNSDIKAKIDVAKFVDAERRSYANRAVPKTAGDIDQLTAQVDKDLALVKGYLSRG